MILGIKRYYTLFFICFLIAQVAIGQSIYEKYDIYRNPIRVILNKFSITATTGYGANIYSHDLSGVYFYQDVEGQFIFSNNVENLGSVFSGYTDWLNDPQEGFQTIIENPFDVPFDYLANPVNNPILGSQQVLLDTDTTIFGFKGVAHGVPILLSLHFNIKDFRIGGGFMYEKQWMRPLNPIAFETIVRPYESNFNSTSYTRWFGLAGYKFYDFWSYDFVAELQVGKVKPGKQFNRGIINRGLYFNIGVSIENNWSEYFRIIVRPSVDIKSYTINLPDGSSVMHRHPSFYVQAGLSINFPDIPRSPMKSDHVQLKHIYTDPKTGRLKEVRGQPIHKRQNPKIGENHRRLWRYKRKNKKKLNPY